MDQAGCAVNRKRTRDTFVRLENQVSHAANAAKNLASVDYWTDRVNQGWEYTKQGVSNAIDYLKDSLNAPGWYWEQWKNRKKPVNEEAKEWENKGFTNEQIKEWTSLGLALSEANFAAWLRDVKSKEIENFTDPQWVKTNFDIDELRQEYQQSQDIKIDIQAKIIQPT